MSLDLNDWQVRRWTRGDGRYYIAWLRQDLWGGWEVHRLWGGRGRRRPGERVDPLVSPAEAGACLHRIAQRRRQHGYAMD